MWLLYIILLIVMVAAHVMIFYLVKAGLAESKKPLPEEVRRRRPIQLHTVLAPRFNQQSEFNLWPSL